MAGLKKDNGYPIPEYDDSREDLNKVCHNNSISYQWAHLVDTFLTHWYLMRYNRYPVDKLRKAYGFLGIPWWEQS